MVPRVFPNRIFKQGKHFFFIKVDWTKCTNYKSKFTSKTCFQQIAHHLGEAWKWKLVTVLTLWATDSDNQSLKTGGQEMVTKDNFDVDTNFHNNYKKKWGEKKGEFACWLSLELKGWTIHSQISDCKKKINTQHHRSVLLKCCRLSKTSRARTTINSLKNVHLLKLNSVHQN